MHMQRLPPRLLRLLLLSSVAFRVDALHGAISRVSSKPQQRPRLWQRASPSLWQRRSSLQAARSEDGALAETRTKPNVVHALILANYATFFADRVLGAWPDKGLYLWHHRWRWWQLLSSCFCHADRAHLGGNTFLLLLFGRSIEDEVGGLGLVLAFCFCGVAANLASLALLPRATVGLGASGAVYGLFAVSVLSRLGPRDLTWTKVVEAGVLGEFVFGRVMSEISTAAAGGVEGINHVAHLSGAGAGVALVLLLRTFVAALEKPDRAVQLERSGKGGVSFTFNSRRARRA